MLFEPKPALLIKDLRTNQNYTVPIQGNSYIDATSFSNIKENNGSGIFIYDEGSRNIACTKSCVSHLNAETGSLQYRQYAIEDLFGKFKFAENMSLLAFGSVPNEEQKSCLERGLARSMLEHLDALHCIRSFPREAPMMTMIMGGVSACAALKPHLIPVLEDRDVYGNGSPIDEHVIRTLSALAVVVCGCYCHIHSVEFREPRLDFGFVENMLYIMSLSSDTSKMPDAEQVRRLEMLLMLHSEHGTCNATVAFLHTASTRADPLSCLLAGLAAIYGPLHGGSNMVTYHQLQKIGSVKNVPGIIQDVKNHKRRLYGFGHRIYRAVDPRATLLKNFLQSRALEGHNADPLLEVALELEHVVNIDPFFTTRKLKANTDLYTVLAYKAIGIPEELVFPFICISRTQGFLAHWRELMARSPTPWRPQQIYTGAGTASSNRSKL